MQTSGELKDELSCSYSFHGQFVAKFNSGQSIPCSVAISSQPENQVCFGNILR